MKKKAKKSAGRKPAATRQSYTSSRFSRVISQEEPQMHPTLTASGSMDFTPPAHERALSAAPEQAEPRPSWLSILLAGVAFGIIAQVVHTIEAIATMQFYLDPAYFPIWSKIMMPGPGAPPAEFYALSILFAIVGGIVFAYMYGVLRASVRQKSALKTGAFYGSILFMVGIPGFLSMYLLLAIPPMLLASWAVSSFVVAVLGATAIAKIIG